MNPITATQTISEPERQPAAITAVDLRSDTVTRPTPEMRRAMAEAVVGDDVYGEESTVNKLQARAAEMFGREAGPLRALRLHGQSRRHQNLDPSRRRSHRRGARPHPSIRDGLISAVAGCMPRTTFVDDGILTWDRIEPLIRPKGGFRAQTALISLESSHNMAGGTVYPPEVSDDICDRAHALGLRVHLDGARIFNAATYLRRDVAGITRKFDSVMFCFSKGLGAPVGSMLVGLRDFIDRARVYRKLYGGGMRQVGVLAAAGLVALEKSPSRLHEDHANARYLAEALARLPGIKIDLKKVQTNIVIFDVSGTGRTAADISAALAKRNVLANATGKHAIRMVTHCDVDRPAIDRALAEFRALLSAA